MLKDYDRTIVAFSGGKDSLACLLWVILEITRLGISKRKIEVWHHLVDGREGSTLMDWPITSAYCRAVCEELGIHYRESWKMGGFEGEMCRRDKTTEPIAYEADNGHITILSSKHDPRFRNTREQFPQVSMDLRTRWCSAYLKIDVSARILANDAKFKNSRTLFITGERGEESPSRARYNEFEPHRAHSVGPRSNRHIDHLRPVLQWPEKVVWKIIEDFRIIPHPAYRLGFGRVSCMPCIFSSANQWATIRKIAPTHFQKISDYEEKWGKTINRSESVVDRANRGKPYETPPDIVMEAMSHEWNTGVIVDNWKLPSGAFGEMCGSDVSEESDAKSRRRRKHRV